MAEPNSIQTNENYKASAAGNGDEKFNCENSNSEDDLEIDTKFITKLQPFDLIYVDGFDTQIGVRYYENKLKECCVVYTMSNIIIIYKLNTAASSSTSNIVGHEMKIIDIQIDKNYKIMMSCDIESVFLWDLQNAEKDDPVILRIIHHPFGSQIKILTSGISHCGRYLLIGSVNVFISESRNSEEDEDDVVAVEHYILQFWEWSYGRPDYDDQIYLPTNNGHLINIRFNCNKNEEKSFALTFPRIVLFGTVQYEKQKMNIFYPKCNITRKITETCFLENSSLVVSCTKKGDVIIWNDNPVCDNSTSEQHINKCLYEKDYYKIISLGTYDLSDIKNFNNYIVTTDSRGETRFYDYNLLLLYIWNIDIDNPQSLLSICPSSKLSNREVTSDAMKDYPRDLTLQHNIFSGPNFFIVNNIGEAYLCEINKSTSKKLTFSASYRIYTDAYLHKPWLVCCLENGLVQIINYVTKNVIAYCNIYKNIPSEQHTPITYCTLSKEENYIGIACRGGYLWVLDPATCQPTHNSIIKIKNNVTSIIFGLNQYCAVVDVKHSIYILKYSDGEWINKTKLRYHIDRIINLFFITYNKGKYLISVGTDRYYNKFQISDIITLTYQKRLEQKPKITSVSLFDASYLYIDIDAKILTTANDLYKIVFYNAYTAERLYTFMGPVFDSPIQRMKYMPPTADDSNSYFIIVSQKTLGAILLPIDGNPYRHSGVLAHHSNVCRVKISWEGTYIMLFGEGDSGGYFWKLNRNAIQKNFECGGQGLQPFCRLLPGGKNGWLFKEMQDYFYYFQIISNAADTSEKTTISEYMKISEIPDFMRALGFFPSEFEIKDVLAEVTRTKYAWQQRPREINFFDLVKLYINHKPIDGYSIEDMLNAIKVVGATAARFIVLDSTEMNVSVDHLLTILTNKGENIPKIQAMKYLTELLTPQGVAMAKRCEVDKTDEEIIEQYKNIHKMTFTATEFCEKLLGLNTVTDPKDGSVLLAFDDRTDPISVFPELENRLPRIAETDNLSDDDNV